MVAGERTCGKGDARHDIVGALALVSTTAANDDLQGLQVNMRVRKILHCGRRKPLLRNVLSRVGTDRGTCRDILGTVIRPVSSSMYR